MRSFHVSTWNCAMALHKKWPALLSLAPDVIVIPDLR
jgi:hypothetical protein